MFTSYENLRDFIAESCRRPGGASAALHVGFTSPPIEEVDHLSKAWPGRLLISEAALLACPEGSFSAGAFAGRAGGASFRLVSFDRTEEAVCNETAQVAGEVDKSRLEIKALIQIGKRDGYLSRQQIRDYVSEHTVQSEIFETIVSILTEFGVTVVAHAPDKGINQIESESEGICRQEKSEPVGVAFSASTEGFVTASGWVKLFLQKQPNYVPDLVGAGISNDESYFSNERRLDRGLRQHLAIQRFMFLALEVPSKENIINHLNALPPWLLQSNVRDLDFPIRVLNVLRAQEVERVSDLLRFQSAQELLKLPNLGRGSLAALCTTLYDALHTSAWEVMRRHEISYDSVNVRSGTASDGIGDESTALGLGVVGANHSTGTNTPSESGQDHLPYPNSLDACFQQAQSLIGERLRPIFAGLVGYRREKRTLQDLGNEYGVSRERIRQIQKKIFTRLHSLGVFLPIIEKLEIAHNSSRAPLYLAGLDGFDSWFNEVRQLEVPLREIIQSFSQNQFHVILVDELAVIAKIDQGEWDKLTVAGEELMREIALKKPPEEEVNFQIQMLLPPTAHALAHLLLTDVCRAAIWSVNESGSRYLIGYGTSAEAVVQALLMDSPLPLHYEELHRRAVDTLGRAFEVRRVHTAAADVGYLFSRGTYGLESHNPLTENESRLVLEEIDDLFSSDSDSRQWHTNEILDALEDRGLALEGRLSKYVIDFLMKRVKTYRSFGRMVWGVRADYMESLSSRRLDIRQAVHSLLEAAGRPLSVDEIKARITEDRGINTHFQIQPGGDLIRLGPGLWGLVGRDIQQSYISEKLDDLRRHLEIAGRGIHLSELPDLLQLKGMDEANAIFSQCETAEIRKDRGQYLFLPAWGDSRRVSLSTAIRIVARELPADGLTLDQLYTRIIEVIRRDISRTSVTYAVRGSEDLRWDPKTDLWCPESDGEGRSPATL